mgnify:CR=1 FL=1
MKNITLKTNNKIATVTLNRPEVRNAMDEATIAALHEAFNKVAADGGIRALVLRGEGKAFCAGGDLNWMRQAADYGEAENTADAQKLGEMLYALNSLNKPTIAMVHGAAFGGGVGLVSACDVALGLENSKFCLSEVKIGLIPSVISPYVLAAMGERQARRFYLTADVMTAEKAKQVGLLHEVYQTENDWQQALEDTLNLILNNAPNAMADAKSQIFDLSHKAITPDVVQQTSEAIAKRRATDEAKEGVSAFLEKRQPYWNSNWKP